MGPPGVSRAPFVGASPTLDTSRIYIVTLADRTLAAVSSCQGAKKS